MRIGWRIVQASTGKAILRESPEVEDLVLDLDASYSDSSTGFSDQADQPQELTYVDIDTFLATF